MLPADDVKQLADKLKEIDVQKRARKTTSMCCTRHSRTLTNR